MTQMHLPAQASTQSDSQADMLDNNTLKAWSPLKRPLAGLVIFAQLALALQPLSVLAQEKGKVNISPMAQSQINRINLLNRDIEAAKVKKTKEQASPADKASADLARIEELSKTLYSDLRARGLSTPAAKLNSKQGTNDQNAKDLRAIGPNLRIETQRSPEQNKALSLADSQRSQHHNELKTLLSQQTSAQAAIAAEFKATRIELEQKNSPLKS